MGGVRSRWCESFAGSQRVSRCCFEYKAIVTLSSHMQGSTRVTASMQRGSEAQWNPVCPLPQTAGTGARRGEWQLLFVGRMDRVKGGDYFLAALPRVASVLSRPLNVTLTGDGPARASWHAAGARLAACEPQIRIEFPGWLAANGSGR